VIALKRHIVMTKRNSIIKMTTISVLLLLLASGFSVMAYGPTSSNPSISGVNFQSSNGIYTITITGNNFGPAPVSMPYTGDLNYFRIADASQLGYGEWGYTGDAKQLTYQNWTNNEIVVSGFQGNPGDAIGIALWNPVTELGATWGGNVPQPPASYPTINSVQFSGSGQNLQMIVNGNNFGTAPVQMPYVGDLNYFSFGDFRTHSSYGSSLFSAGFEGWGVFSPDSVTLNYQSWTNNQIIISGFSGTYGQDNATVENGDPILITLWSTGASSYTGPQTMWGGFVSTTATTTSYTVTFTESGLPSGTSWSITLNGTTESSTSNIITFNEPNGTYTYSVAAISGYSSSPSSGSLTVNGANVNEAITFTPVSVKTYTVAFMENGLPSGSQWSVTLNGNTESSTSPWIVFNVPNGTYSFSIGAVTGYTAFPSSGTITVSGDNTDEGITFSPVTYVVAFTENGLPSGIQWSVRLNGTTRSSTTNTITFNEPNGTYSYSVASVSGYMASPLSGTIMVNGADLFIPITFNSVKTTVVFFDNFFMDNYLNTSRWIFDSSQFSNYVQNESKFLNTYNESVGVPQLPLIFSSNGMEWDSSGEIASGITSVINFVPPFNISVSGTILSATNQNGTVLILIDGGTAQSTLSIVISNGVYLQQGYSIPKLGGNIYNGMPYKFTIYFNLNQNFHYNATVIIDGSLKINFQGYLSMGNGQGYSLSIGAYSSPLVGAQYYPTGSVDFYQVNVTSPMNYNVFVQARPSNSELGETLINAEITLTNLFSFEKYTNYTNSTGGVKFLGVPDGTYILNLTVSNGNNYLFNTSIIQVGSVLDPENKNFSYTMMVNIPPVTPLEGVITLGTPDFLDDSNLTVGIQGLKDTFIAGISGGVGNFTVSWYINGIRVNGQILKGSNEYTGVENFILNNTFNIPGTYIVNYTVTSQGYWYNIPQNLLTTSKDEKIEVRTTAEILSLQNMNEGTISVSFHNIQNEVLAWVTSNGILLNANVTTDNIGIPLPAWLMNIIGISNPWYGVGINDSAGSADSNEIIQPYSSPVSIDNLSLPSGTPVNLENYILSFWLNPLSNSALLSNLVTVAFGIIGVITAFATSSVSNTAILLEIQLIISSINFLASTLASEGITGLSASNIASVVGQFGISIVLSLASFLMSWALAKLSPKLLDQLAETIGVKLGLDDTGVGEAIAIGQLIIDLGAIMDAIVAGTLYTNYKVVNVQKFYSLSVSDPPAGVPYVYVTENESNYGYNNGWMYPSNQFFMHSAGIQNGYSFLFPDPNAANITVENPNPSSLVFNLTVNAPSGSITFPVSIAGDQVKEYTLSQSNGTIKIIPKYAITFTESGLPSGKSWSVTLNGSTLSSTTNTIVFNEPNGTYSFTIGSIMRYTASPSSGSVTVSGTSLNVAVTFTFHPPAHYRAYFNETGLPEGTTWGITILRYNHTSDTSDISINLPNGRYAFTVIPVPGYTANPSNGTLYILDGSAVIDITFIPVSSVQFSVEGLPSNMIWSVTLDGITKSTDGTVITFAVTPGNYTYSVNLPEGYSASGYDGNLHIQNSTVNIKISASPIETADQFGISYAYIMVVLVSAVIILIGAVLVEIKKLSKFK